MKKNEQIAKIELKIEQLIAKREKLTGEANRGPFVPIPDDGKCPAGWYYSAGKCILDS